uniref:Mitochondrial carrier protein n=1 Tax=Chrysotila carterae TaxID=13221 RepID=A0A6S9URV5_CHRCT
MVCRSLPKRPHSPSQPDIVASCACQEHHRRAASPSRSQRMRSYRQLLYTAQLILLALPHAAHASLRRQDLQLSSRPPCDSCATRKSSQADPVVLSSSASSVSTVARPTFISSAIAGGAASATATVAFHPVDTIKTVLQRRGSAAGHGALRSVVRDVGGRGLYRGVLPAALSMMPACAVRMGAYEVLKKQLAAQPWEMPAGALVFVASALSVVVSASVRSPLDMIKTQVQTGAAGSAAAAIRVAVGSGGLSAVSAFYRGAGLTLLRDVPFFSINLLLYEQLKARALAMQGRETVDGVAEAGALPAMQAILLGAIAQGIAGFSTTPADRLKTYVQSGAAIGVKAAFSDILRKEGVAGLMAGAGLRTLWIMPQGCIYYPVYELVQRAMSPKSEEIESPKDLVAER